jgi:hypothetical protein
MDVINTGRKYRERIRRWDGSNGEETVAVNGEERAAIAINGDIRLTENSCHQYGRELWDECGLAHGA